MDQQEYSEMSFTERTQYDAQQATISRQIKGESMVDIKKMRVCAPLLPPPGDEVVCECLNEIERLREALTEIASGDRTAHECVNWAKLALR